ncbi:putative F-box domain-containing protein [Medicago truncatula]|uniref:Cyclin-like F-box n=1 Tax=Medicago truncatula TaxID=3880 RepID=Q2HSY4_MEDTR|nr:F-box protein At2g26850 [Medicago truncatula]ABD33039.1 Cyclin-like F-box [Medicago truncatula]AES81196.2 F-box plant-like protein [Medicago truncatula]RHN47726.1 putative F-box domain-containing protein [Medicago truncatula]
MFYILISFVSFVMILSKSFINKPLSSNVKKLVSNGFCGKLLSFLASRLKTRTIFLPFSFFQFSLGMQLQNKSCLVSKVEYREEEEEKASLLDLHDLPLDCILEKLSPSELCNVAQVCKSLREKCRSDYLWEKHMKMKWGKILGDSAYRQWKCYVASKSIEKNSNQHKNQKTVLAFLHAFLPFFWIKSKSEKYIKSRPDDSIAALYLSLENGKFWFPAQVYNRENGHAGFLLSCYDAELCYDSRTDTFQARYSPHGRWTTEENIKWERLRVPPIDSSSHVLHISDCLDDLKPGDHVEIQWRRNNEFPYGWWYSVIGHLETCQGDGNHCQCHDKDTVILEFTQYTAGSRWRQTMINRKNHREQGNEIEGFYGGIRKLHSKEEITKWKKLWPTKNVE